MSTIYFHQKLRAEILEMIEAETERLASGAYSEFPVYREQVGYLRALKTVLEIGEEIEKGMT